MGSNTGVGGRLNNQKPLWGKQEVGPHDFLCSTVKAERLVLRLPIATRQCCQSSVADPATWNGLQMALRPIPLGHSALSIFCPKIIFYDSGWTGSYSDYLVLKRHYIYNHCNNSNNARKYMYMQVHVGLHDIVCEHLRELNFYITFLKLFPRC